MATLAEMAADRLRTWQAGGRERAEPGNLLGLELGDRLTFDTDDEYDVVYTVESVMIVTEQAGGRDHVFSAYTVTGLTGTRRTRWLLAYPGEPACVPPAPCSLVLLSPDFGCGFQEAVESGLYDPGHHPGLEPIPALQGPSGLFNDHATSSVYRRRFGELAEPHRVRVKTFCDDDRSGRVDPGEVRTTDATYWDYELSDGPDAVADQAPLMWVFEDHDGWFTILKGRAIAPERVALFF